MYDIEIQRKLDAIELAERLGNVSEAARLSGCSRETIYNNRRLLREKGPQTLKRTLNPDHHHKNRTPKEIEETVIAFSLEGPHRGQVQIAAQLREKHQIEISQSTIWLREKLNTVALRVERAK